MCYVKTVGQVSEKACNKPTFNINLPNQVNLHSYSTIILWYHDGMSTAEDLVVAEGIDIADPVQLKRFMTAAEVMKLHLESDLSITVACKQVGISRATYSRWVKDGVFQPLIQAYVGPIQLDLQSRALQGIGEFLTWLIETSAGRTKDATNFDIMNAGKMLWTEFAGPLIDKMAPVVEPKPEEANDEGQEYLDSEPKWKLGPGEKVVETTVTERSPAPVDVTPREETEI